MENQIEHTVAGTSAADDSPAQSELRAELRRSGLKVCYQSRRDGNSELYIMNADGSENMNITNTPDVDEVYPHVSSDGHRVCFTTVAREGRNVRFDVHWMNMDGSNRTLVATDATDPCWDPSGTRIAFVKRLSREKTVDYQNDGLFVHDIRTGETEEITGGKLYHAYVPCFSPAGDWAVATVHEHADFGHAIIAINLKTGNIHSLRRNAVGGCRPDFSWDGKMLCWNPDDYNINVAQFRPECTETVPSRTIACAPSGGSVYFGDWSPDGKYIAYSMNPDVKYSHPKTRIMWDIFVTRSAGGVYVQLTFDHANNKQPEFFSIGG